MSKVEEGSVFDRWQVAVKYIYIYREREIEIALSLPQLECPLTNISSRPLKAQDGPQPSEVYVNQASCALSSWISDAFRHSATVDARDLTAR